MSSKKSFYEKYYEDQPKVTKGIINVIVVGGVAFAAWQIWRAAKKRKLIENANDFPNMAAAELKELEKRGIKPSYYLSMYESFSQQIAQAMGGCGTDESAILRVMKQMKNEADVLMLIHTFGVRPYEPCFYSDPTDHAIWVFNQEAFPMALDGWFSRDLSTGDIADINDALRGNGIAYRF
jgi:hypothetical protein